VTSRLIVATIASCLAACGSHHDPPAASCADACAAIFACAAHFDYGLSQTVGTQSDCTAACDAGDCPAKRQVNDCIVSLSCTTGIDTYGIAALQCGTANQCSLGVLLPIGACDSIASDVQWASGQCAEYLGDDTALDYSKGYCTGAMHGTWVSTCPTSNRVGSCLIVVEGVASRTTYYSSYTGDLAYAESLCVNNTYGGEWTAY